MFKKTKAFKVNNIHTSHWQAIFLTSFNSLRKFRELNRAALVLFRFDIRRLIV